MTRLKEYASDTLASNGNQTVFTPCGTETGMVFLKVFKGGTYPRAFAFSSVIDSTFADGSKSRCNDVCRDFRIVSLKFAVTGCCEPEKADSLPFTPVLFGGSESAQIGEKEFFFTDPVTFNAEKGQYICLKIEYCGTLVPCHYESIISVFKKVNGNWQSSTEVPLPVFTGAQRPVKKRIAFLGDSITQGIGTVHNSYAHSAAVAADILGDENAYWDLGIGYARGADAATDGMWLKKAKANDIVTVCYGVNDMFQGRTVEQIKADLLKIVTALQAAGAKVIIQTVPPFDYGAEHEKMWRSVNGYIRTVLKEKADGFVDTVPVLSLDGGDSPKSGFGPHPNNEGNLRWGKVLASEIQKLINKE